jgi:hypothetical protein
VHENLCDSAFDELVVVEHAEVFKEELIWTSDWGLGHKFWIWDWSFFSLHWNISG